MERCEAQQSIASSVGQVPFSLGSCGSSSSCSSSSSSSPVAASSTVFVFLMARLVSACLRRCSIARVTTCSGHCSVLTAGFLASRYSLVLDTARRKQSTALFHVAVVHKSHHRAFCPEKGTVHDVGAKLGCASEPRGLTFESDERFCANVVG